MQFSGRCRYGLATALKPHGSIPPDSDRLGYSIVYALNKAEGNRISQDWSRTTEPVLEAKQEMQGLHALRDAHRLTGRGLLTLHALLRTEPTQSWLQVQ